MNVSDKLINGIIESDESFRTALRNVLKTELRMSVPEFSEKAGISQSTIYKLLSGDREPNLKTVRLILSAIRKIEGSISGSFIGVIATRPVLDKIEERTIKIEGKNVTIREYPANSMEEAIISAIRAEREGALSIVCAPIVSSTVEKILRIPVAIIMPEDSLLKAIRLAAKKAAIA